MPNLIPKDNVIKISTDAENPTQTSIFCKSSFFAPVVQEAIVLAEQTLAKREAANLIKKVPGHSQEPLHSLSQALSNSVKDPKITLEQVLDNFKRNHPSEDDASSKQLDKACEVLRAVCK